MIVKIVQYAFIAVAVALGAIALWGMMFLIALVG